MITVMNSPADPGLQFREATVADLPQLIAMLADDELGRQREDTSSPVAACYRSAFDAIETDPLHQILLACSEAGDILGMLQLSFLPNLSRRGAWRAQIEGVRVSGQARGQGIGRELVEEAIRRAGERHCLLVQLTSDRQRPDAIRFYESLGFEASHIGLKRSLTTEGGTR